MFLDQKKNELDLKNFKGKLILLNFWATWCAPCKDEMPSLDKLQNTLIKYHSKSHFVKILNTN